jgi:predicted Zn-dependent peptidase
MLFQTVREERGLAYSIYSEPNFYDALGTLVISFGVSMENLKETLTLIAEAINTLKKHKVSTEALEHAKNHLRGSFFLNLEGSDNYMDMIGRIELFAHKEKSIDDMINKINHISIEGINSLIDVCLDKDKVAFAIVGEIETKHTEAYYKHFLSVLND